MKHLSNIWYLLVIRHVGLIVFTVCYFLSFASFLLHQEREVKFFTETEENNQMRGPRTGVPYFLWVIPIHLTLSTVILFQHLIIAAPVRDGLRNHLIRTGTTWILAHIRWKLCLISVIFYSWSSVLKDSLAVNCFAHSKFRNYFYWCYIVIHFGSKYKILDYSLLWEGNVFFCVCKSVVVAKVLVIIGTRIWSLQAYPKVLHPFFSF